MLLLWYSRSWGCPICGSFLLYKANNCFWKYIHATIANFFICPSYATNNLWVFTQCIWLCSGFVCIWLCSSSVCTGLLQSRSVYTKFTALIFQMHSLALFSSASIFSNMTITPVFQASGGINVLTCWKARGSCSHAEYNMIYFEFCV